MIETASIKHSLDLILPMIKKRNESLDLISNELKEVEAHFIEAGLIVPVRAKFHVSETSYPDSVNLFDQELRATGLVHYIVWDKFSADGQKTDAKWRLLYQANEEYFPSTFDPKYLQNWMESESWAHQQSRMTPLVQAPIDMRQRAHSEMKRFFDQTLTALGYDDIDTIVDF